MTMTRLGAKSDPGRPSNAGKRHQIDRSRHHSIEAVEERDRFGLHLLLSRSLAHLGPHSVFTQAVLRSSQRTLRRWELNATRP